jgi:hypothetical protein
MELGPTLRRPRVAGQGRERTTASLSRRRRLDPLSADEQTSLPSRRLRERKVKDAARKIAAHGAVR